MIALVTTWSQTLADCPGRNSMGTSFIDRKRSSIWTDPDWADWAGWSGREFKSRSGHQAPAPDKTRVSPRTKLLFEGCLPAISRASDPAGPKPRRSEGQGSSSRRSLRRTTDLGRCRGDAFNRRW